MLKYVDTAITFAEFPNEISLCINISNCPCNCIGCHSSYLSEDIGEILSVERLQELINTNEGITLVGFMGGDSNPEEVNNLAEWIKQNTSLKVGWYSGRNILSDKINLKWFDYVKLGPYIEQFGPLNNPNTNQKFYKIDIINNSPIMTWCTNLFWKEAE